MAIGADGAIRCADSAERRFTRSVRRVATRRRSLVRQPIESQRKANRQSFGQPVARDCAAELPLDRRSYQYAAETIVHADLIARGRPAAFIPFQQELVARHFAANVNAALGG